MKSDCFLYGRQLYEFCSLLAKPPNIFWGGWGAKRREGYSDKATIVSSSCFSANDKLKVRFLFTAWGEKLIPHSLHRVPWDMTSLGPITGRGFISVEWCKWWQIPSSLIMCVRLIGVTHWDGCFLALGWGAELPDWIIQKRAVIRVLSSRFPSPLLWLVLLFTCIQM